MVDFVDDPVFDAEANAVTIDFFSHGTMKLLPKCQKQVGIVESTATEIKGRENTLKEHFQYKI